MFGEILPSLRIARLHPNAVLPTYGSDGAIGLDLYALTDILHGEFKEYRIRPGARVMVHTGISMAIPEGYYGRVAPRSGLALNHGIDVLAGVIDSDYRGEVNVILQNLGINEFVVKGGNRIAQLIIERADRLSVCEVDSLDDTARGAGGYGSTGV